MAHTRTGFASLRLLSYGVCKDPQQQQCDPTNMLTPKHCELPTILPPNKNVALQRMMTPNKFWSQELLVLGYEIHVQHQNLKTACLYIFSLKIVCCNEYFIKFNFLNKSLNFLCSLISWSLFLSDSVLGYQYETRAKTV